MKLRKLIMVLLYLIKKSLITATKGTWMLITKDITGSMAMKNTMRTTTPMAKKEEKKAVHTGDIRKRTSLNTI